jgi:hypothetical protein
MIITNGRQVIYHRMTAFLPVFILNTTLLWNMDRACFWHLINACFDSMFINRYELKKNCIITNTYTVF